MEGGDRVVREPCVRIVESVKGVRERGWGKVPETRFPPETLGPETPKCSPDPTPSRSTWFLPPISVAGGRRRIVDEPVNQVGVWYRETPPEMEG